jgi:membrane associated rhomboid family serine protease
VALSALYVFVLASAAIAGANGAASLSSRTSRPRAPLATICLFAAVATPSLLQLVYPVILRTLERDAARIAGGEWWRLVTPLFVQDGGASGTVFNLISLLVVGTVAERIWSRWQTAALFLASGLAGEIAGLAWKPVGAGNSVGNFGLAAAVAIACLSRHAPPRARLIAAASLAGSVALLCLQNLHGAASLGGAALALAFTMTSAHQ